MLKKIIALVLCFSLFLGMAVSADSVYSIADDKKTGYKFLAYLGIFNNSDLEKIGTNTYVTRGEFVDKVVCALKLNNVSYTGNVIFSDVVPSHKYYQSIMTAYLNGVAGGNGERFNPDENITLIDAVVIALRILGYGDYCKNIGGYPAGFAAAASRLDLTDGIEIKSSDYLTKDTAAQFILNMITAPVLDINSVVNNNIKYTNKDCQTVLSIYYNIYEAFGVVESNGITPLSYGDYYIENSLVVDNIRYEITDELQNEYIGYNARIFYKAGKNDSIGKIVYMSECDNEVFNVDAKDFVAADKRSVKYLENNKEKKISLGVDTKYIYNGKALDVNGDYLKYINNLSGGSITFIDNNMDGKYEVVKIWSYKNIVFANYNSADHTIYDVMDNANNICLEEKDYVITDSNGVKRNFDDLKKYDILSVGESADGEYVKIIVSYNRITGTLDALTYKENKAYDKVYIGDNIYEVSDSVKNIDDFKLVIGMKGTFCMSYDNKLVYYFETEKGDITPAFLLSLTKEDERKRSNKATALVLTSDGKQKKIDLSDKVVFDGTLTKTSDVYEKLMNGETRLTPRIMCYMLGADGKITYIDTENQGERESKNSLHKIRSKADAELIYKSGNKNFGIKFWPGKQPVFFGAPMEYGEDIDFESFALTTLRNDHKSPIELYSIGENDVAYDICVAFGEYSDSNANIERGANMAVVKKVSNGATDDGEILYKLTVYERTNQKSIFIDPKRNDKISELNCGSIIRYGINANGYIGYWEVLYDSKTKTYPKADSYGYYSTGTKDKFIPDGDEFSFGYVYDVIDSYYIRLTTKPEYINEETPYAYPLKGGAYLIRTGRSDCEVIEISADDIKDYVHFGTNAYRGAAFVTYGDVNKDKYFLFIE
ncbi:MAG: S-layer homology domain-containing protein [Oscillospiraceae bacterium]|nr:S-layer homology domain-containing protein [Oscillospiraceae bacterium]